MGSPSLAEVYEKICKGMGREPRPLLSKAMEKIDERVSCNEKIILFLEAPTGYGKSTLSLSLYAALKMGRDDLAQRVIHVLPMRSIGTDLQERMRKDIRNLKAKGFPLREADVGLQQMHSPGSPMLCKRFVITTLDTFISCFYKMPAAEISKIERYGTSHFEIPRACIYSAVVVFDEFHLYISSQAAMNGESKSLTATIACIISLLNAGVPVIISTATLPRCIKNLIKDHLELTGQKDSIEEILPSKEDKNFVKRDLTVSTYVGNVADLIKDLDENKKILVIFNTVSQAVRNYLQLKNMGFRPVLLHSRLIEKTRRDRLGQLTDKKGEGLLVVATQVVEAGVDKSFDVLVTEASSPDSLLQRAGRVARCGGEGQIYVMPVTEQGAKVYGETIPCQLYRYVEKEKSIDYNMLEIIDNIVKESNVILLDKVYRGFLEDIDSYPSYSIEFAQRVWNAVCGFVRDGEQVPVIPVQHVDSGDKIYDHLFCIDDEYFTRLYHLNKITEAIYEDGSRKPVEKISVRECIAKQFFRHGIVAVLTDFYDEEVGLYEAVRV
ncbi:MAG: CRISPR-associated helicase Cas3' [Candidatus Caldarchaeum sp.]